ncbi:hypothetical protein M422DRAFT_253842 [Sphaerobolus stellatus SS14]|uniref:Secreted protein n=1 Tax=Sphaerobolus stellatus (strain SS14) TaxID=990650 RepID=A0A0C9VMH9_SPHS4|nr:hypothetical protein M422DRAFT_253842 [Sphaerobolus stellatus SS14]
MTSQACHWPMVFAAFAVWRTRCSCDLVLVATVRRHKKALSDSILHAKSMRSTPVSRPLPTPLRAAPATTFPWLALLATTRFLLCMISQMRLYISYIVREHRDHVSTLRSLLLSIQDSVSHRPLNKNAP